MCQNEGTHSIVMSFSPLVVGCFLKKAHKGGRGHRRPRTPLATPLCYIKEVLHGGKIDSVVCTNLRKPLKVHILLVRMRLVYSECLILINL